MSVTDGQKSYENFEQDSLRSVKNGRTADSLENQKTALLKTVGSERSLHSGVSGNCFEVCLQSFLCSQTRVYRISWDQENSVTYLKSDFHLSNVMRRCYFRERTSKSSDLCKYSTKTSDLRVEKINHL